MMEASLNFPESSPDRSPPFSMEAETAVLGGMLIDSEAVTRAVEHLDDSMFYREANRRLYRVMLRIFERGGVLDVITVAEELKKTGEIDEAGGFEYLSSLVSAVPTAANLEYHAQIVREKALLRRLIEQSSQIIRDVYDQGERDVDEILDKAEARIFQVAETHKREGFVWIKEILWPAFEHIEALQESESGITGLTTGFHDLDRMTAGLQKGDLCIVAARPSMGKTSWVLNVAANAAISHNIPVAVFSLEMSAQQLVQRMLCSEGRVDAQKLRLGRLSQSEHERLAKAAGYLNTAPLWIDDQPGANVLEIRAKARRLQSEVRADGQDLGKVAAVEGNDGFAAAVGGGLRHRPGLGHVHSWRFLHRGVQTALKAVDDDGLEMPRHRRDDGDIGSSDVEHLPVVGIALDAPFGDVSHAPPVVQLGDSHQLHTLV